MKASSAGFAAVLAVISALPSPTARAEDRGEWEWMVAPYVWAASIKTDLSVPFPVADGGSDFSIIDKIDGAFEAHVEAQNEDFGVFADLTYLGLADTVSRQRIDIRTSLDAVLFEAAAVWSPGDGRLKGVELFGGLRYIDVETNVNFDPQNPVFDTLSIDPGKSYSDFMLGARYTWAFAERWRLTLRGDGSFGDTEGTWNASIVGQYRVSYGEWLLGYRYLNVEVEDRRNEMELSLHGPMVGFGFVF